MAVKRRLYNDLMFLDIAQLSVSYPERNRLSVDRVSLSLRAGEMGVLIGPSGCGKTTLLRAVAGLEPASAGEIRLAKSVVSSANAHVAPEARRIGMVFQDYALFPHLTVHDNVSFGLYKQPRAEREARVREVLALVGLSSNAQRYPHELSGGQQQRVALAVRWHPSRNCCCSMSRSLTLTSSCANAWLWKFVAF